jgi:hypothetical protein
MFTSAVLCVVIGIILGLIFQSVVLIPMNSVVLAAVAALGISHGDALSTMIVKAVIAIGISNLGYVCGVAVRLLVRRHAGLERDR